MLIEKKEVVKKCLERFESDNLLRCCKRRFIERCHFNYLEEITKQKGNSFSEKVYRWLNLEYNNLGECLECHSETNYKSLGSGFSEYCSTKCSASSLTKQKKIYNTNKEKYGVGNVSQVKDIKERKKDTFQVNYGKDHIWSKKEGEERSCDKTIIEKYGVDNVFKSEEIQKKIRQSYLLKYNASSPMQNSSILNKSRETLFTNYQVTNPRYLVNLKPRKLKEIKLVHTSVIEDEIMKTINGQKLKIENKEFDIFVEYNSRKILFEIDGDYFHPNKLEKLSLIQMNSVLNDFRKENILKKYSEYKLYHVYISNLPKEITIESLINSGSNRNYSIDSDTVFLMSTYYLNYIKNKGEEKFKKYYSLIYNFIYELAGYNLPYEEFQLRLQSLINVKEDITLKKLWE